MKRRIDRLLLESYTNTIYIVNIFQEFYPVTSISVYITPIIDTIVALKINK